MIFNEFNPHSSRKLQGWRHIGHSCRTFCCDSSHFMTHCIWKACPHFPDTGGQSSPGYFSPGQQASYGLRQMPHTWHAMAHYQKFYSIERSDKDQYLIIYLPVPRGNTVITFDFHFHELLNGARSAFVPKSGHKHQHESTLCFGLARHYLDICIFLSPFASYNKFRCAKANVTASIVIHRE